MSDSFINRYGRQYAAIADYENIPGFISENEAVALYDIAKQLPTSDAVAIEIGSLVGRSSFLIAKGLAGKINSRLYCIDPFVGIDPNDKTDISVREKIFEMKNSLGVERYRDIFVANMTKYKVIDKIKLMEGYSYQFAKSFDKQLDFLFIDGGHDYEDVLRDYLDWSPKIKPGGHIAIHDVYFCGGEHEGPNKVVQKYLLNRPGKNNQRWVYQQLHDCLFIARKVSSG